MKNSARLTGTSMPTPSYGGPTLPPNAATATSSPPKPHSISSSTGLRPRSAAELHAPGTSKEKTSSLAKQLSKAALQLMSLEQEATNGKANRQPAAVVLLADIAPALQAKYKALQGAVPKLQEEVRNSRRELRHAEQEVETLEQALNDRQAAVHSQEQAIEEAKNKEKVTKDVEPINEAYEADLKQRRQVIKERIEVSEGDLALARANTEEAEPYHAIVQDFKAAGNDFDAQTEIVQKWLKVGLAKAIRTDPSFEDMRSDSDKVVAYMYLNAFFKPPSTDAAHGENRIDVRTNIDHLLHILADPVITRLSPEGKPGCAETLQSSIARMATSQFRAGPTSESYGIRAGFYNMLSAWKGAEAELKGALVNWCDANRSRLGDQLMSPQLHLNASTPLKAGYTLLLRLKRGLGQRPGVLNAAVAVKVEAFQTLTQNPPPIAEFRAVEADLYAALAADRSEVNQINNQFLSMPTPTTELDQSHRQNIKLEHLKHDLHIALSTSAKTITDYTSALEKHAELVDALTQAKANLEDFRQDQVDARGRVQRVRQEAAEFRAQNLAEQNAAWQRIQPQLVSAFTPDGLKRAIDRHLDIDAQKLEQRLKPELTRATAYSTRGNFLMAVVDALTVADLRDGVLAGREMLVSHDRQIGLGLRKNGSPPAEETPSHATMFRLDDAGRIAHIYPWIPHRAEAPQP